MDKIKMALLRKFFKVLAAFFCGGAATVNAQEIPPMNVLFIGNSFTHMNSMPVMFEKLAISGDVELTHLAIRHGMINIA